MVRLPCGHDHTRAALCAYVADSTATPCDVDHDLIGGLGIADTTDKGNHDGIDTADDVGDVDQEPRPSSFAHLKSLFLTALITSASIVAPATIAFVLMGTTAIAMLSE
jgi:hypothetical protein